MCNAADRVRMLNERWSDPSDDEKGEKDRGVWGTKEESKRAWARKSLSERDTRFDEGLRWALVLDQK